MTPTQNGPPRIADHGLIGDLRTAALVALDGSVDWFCAPRFDSPSLFGALLDPDRGGRCRIRPAGFRGPARQMYFPDTAVLVTRFMTDEGTGEVVDFMPPGSEEDGVRRLIRMVRCVRGTLDFEVEVAPRFDYGRQDHSVHVVENGVVFDGGDTRLVLHVVREPGETPTSDVRADGRDVHAHVTLHAGQVRGIVLETGGSDRPRRVRVAEVEQAFHDTVRFWHGWLGHSTYRGRWREAVDRSAITLKLLTYAPTGAMVAAPTAGLPEQLGGERNWDYRYTWIRDASFGVSALLRLGFVEEAAAFTNWLGERYQQADGDDGPLRIMYRVDGSPDLPEEVLDHWAGYRGSRPVRIGNDAGGQLQLDIYGELLDGLHHAHRNGLRIGRRGWQALTSVVDWLSDNWDRPDEGIWETRDGRADFTYGRAMSWVAFDRALRLAQEQSLPAPVARWRAERDRVHQQVWSRGWDPRRRALVQRYGSDVLDSSLLRLAQVGFVAPRDPMWLDTLAAVERDLVVDSLVLRYDPSASPDGLRGDEGTFSLCTFNYVDALARAGRTGQARLVFEKMLTYANHVGLFAEEIGPTGGQLGNFPQAFTHLGLIDAAVTLDDALDRTGS
ncbi:glycoside hydrolase family 15 protein [Actinosynnema sp. NPDC047251]|uniref:Glycoside hydrolase 15-like protein n=1 Tax=Saccharothrix espanaensis (strain ATCC 51144 / DSM 44229 / JCM 9112 / NBRC 15066 / NRRL 15764) TaxID=1179773 RepID=K0K8K9_SACES|nr:glycoside hydrolase family 15 protein [Saccharothrix espanaensis]CCH33159.1 Glycoside hydrolase 15-like protein [Saccharothrix espanaensis DSM 44229]